MDLLVAKYLRVQSAKAISNHGSISAAKSTKKKASIYQANGKGSTPRGLSRYRQVLSLLLTSIMTGLGTMACGWRLLRAKAVLSMGKSSFTRQNVKLNLVTVLLHRSQVEPGSVSLDQINRKLSIFPLLPLISFILSAKLFVKFKRLRFVAGSPTTKVALSVCQAFE